MTLRKRHLLWVPFAVYALSYAYLALYHGRVWLLSTVVHEGGTYTLLQTVFYASHMLGHLPSLTVIALLFAGHARMLLDPQPSHSASSRRLVAVLIAFLGLTTVIAFTAFGREDTLAFLSQAKQGVAIYAEGGSWNLHLPSTMLLFALCPVYVYVIARLLGTSVRYSVSGLPLVLDAAGMTVLFTVLFNSDPLAAVVMAWTNPRYLAHSVRELATFTLTFFPLPLALAVPKWSDGEAHRSARIGNRWIAASFVVTIAAVAYQCCVPLVAGIGELAQKPPFAKGGQLGVPYLLASHYFEHVLDTVYFTLLVLLLWSMVVRRAADR